MTAEPNRQPQGIPTGGQFATKTQSDDVPALAAPAGQAALLGLLDDRDAVRERRERIADQNAALNLQSARYSARGLAATLLIRCPDAATLRIVENEDAAGQFRAESLIAADGTVLESAESDPGWIEAEAPNGTYVYEFVDDLPFDDVRWAEDIATIAPGNKYDFKSVDIDLRAAATKPVPFEEDLEDIAKRPLTEDEQETLVNAAKEGIDNLQDKIFDRASDYSASEIDELKELLDAASKVLN